MQELFVTSRSSSLTAGEFERYPLVLRHASRAILVMMVFFGVGGHWAALQSVAWASMLAQYSRNAPLSVALAQTFDGKHPCGLCKGIVAAQQSKKKRDAQPAPIKVDIICATRTINLFPAVVDFWFSGFEMRALRRVPSPPIPPPRSQVA